MRPLRLSLVVVLFVVGVGCDARTHLIATPTVALGERGRTTFDALPPDARTPSMQILYAADRDIVAKTPLGVQYGSGRSGQLVVGTARIGFDRQMSWEDLVAASTQKRWPATGGRRPAMTVESTAEFGRVGIPLKEMEVIDGRYQLTPELREEVARTTDALHGVMRDRLAHADRKDVYLYVHGFNNTFEDALFRLSMFWHFAGRPGVAIAYTWPAGRGGLTGYAYDRESGEFTVFHLKLFIRALASCPDVERLHIIGHSRGCDVVCTALRELNIETRAKDLRTQEQLKLHNLVLAAPDLDADVFEQRVAIEDLHLAAHRMTIYFSQTDFALAASAWLFGGGERMGNLTPGKFSPDARRKLAALKSVHMINCDVSGFSTSHDYAFAHPAVASDLILLLRDDLDPGVAHGRPLSAEFEGVWEIDNEYLLGPPPPAPARPVPVAK